MILLPAIDLQRGRVSRLLRGNFNDPVFYSLDPVGTAMSFFETGFSYLHIVDLDGAKNGKPAHTSLLRDICSTGMTVHYGGGLREIADIEKVLEIGAARAMVGSLLFSSPKAQEELYERFGERIIPAVDVKGGRVSIRGWTEELELSPQEILKGLLSAGFGQILVTAVDRDGTGIGPDLELYRELREAFPGMAFTAAGGIASLEDLKALEKMGMSDAVVGKALYEGALTLEQALEVERPC